MTARDTVLSNLDNLREAAFAPEFGGEEANHMLLAISTQVITYLLAYLDDDELTEAIEGLLVDLTPELA